MASTRGAQRDSVLRDPPPLPHAATPTAARAHPCAAAPDARAPPAQVKAANVLLDERQHAKVTDFGISTKHGPGMGHTAETGTYRSMAPEVISHQTYDYKCDVYSFAVLLWEIAHQQIPFEDDNALQVTGGWRGGAREQGCGMNRRESCRGDGW